MTRFYSLWVMAGKREAQQCAAALEELAAPRAVAVSWIEMEDAGAWRVEALYAKKPDPAAVSEHVGRMTGRPADSPKFLLTEVPDEDWVAKVQRDLAPVRAGRFFVHGRHDRARAGAQTCALQIDAGQAFGTAHHGTTKGCLIALDSLLKRGLLKRREFQKILDIGTGTGVLAIAAAKILRKPVIAGDIDPVAVRVARENARLNGVASWVRCLETAGLSHPVIRRNGPYDLVMANILAGPLVAMAQELIRHTEKGGYILLSGVLPEQTRAVSARFQTGGATLYKRFEVEGWTTLVLHNR